MLKLILDSKMPTFGHNNFFEKNSKLSFSTTGNQVLLQQHIMNRCREMLSVI